MEYCGRLFPAFHHLQCLLQQTRSSTLVQLPGLVLPPITHPRQQVTPRTRFASGHLSYLSSFVWSCGLFGPKARLLRSAIKRMEFCSCGSGPPGFKCGSLDPATGSIDFRYVSEQLAISPRGVRLLSSEQGRSIAQPENLKKQKNGGSELEDWHTSRDQRVLAWVQGSKTTTLRSAAELDWVKDEPNWNKINREMSSKSKR